MPALAPPVVALGFAPADASRDQALVTRARAGDRSAEEALYRTHVQAVAALAMRLLGRGSDAEDVVQDAFVSALSRLSQLRDGRLFRAWVLRITVHEVHRRFRRRKLLRVLGLESGRAEVELAQLAAPSLSAEGRAELTRIDRALCTLPSADRLAWLLRHVEGYELAEIASACAASLATIKRRIVRAEQRIASHLDPKPGEARHE